MRYPFHHGRRVRIRDRKGNEAVARVTSFRGRKMVVELEEDVVDKPNDFLEWAALRPIGEQVQEARLASGLTQSELGARSGFDDGYISKIERGLILPTSNGLIRLARGLNLPLVIGPGQDHVRCQANERRKKPYGRSPT